MTIEDSWGGDIVTAAISHLAHSTPTELLFTSTDCDQCAAARGALKKAGIEYREVTYELEAARFERYGVQGVPLLARLRESGEQSFLAAGVPTRGSLRAVRRD